MIITVTKDDDILPFGLLLDSYASTIPFFSEVEESATAIPGLDGEIQTSSRYAAKSHVLVMKSEKDTLRDDKAALYFKLNDYLSTIKDKDGILHYKKLSSIFYVRAMGLAAINKEYSDWIEFRVLLKSHDPFRYSDSETEVIKTGFVVNKGNAKAYARLEFDGPAINPYAVVGDVLYKYNGSVSDGRTLIVNSSDYTAKITSKDSKEETDVTALWNGNFLILPRGDTAVNDICREDGSARIVWRDRWI